MPLFSYIAKDPNGRIERSTINAVSAEEVRENLRKKNLTVEDVLETVAVTPTPIVPSFTASKPWTTIEDAKEEKKVTKAMAAEELAYFPLVDTLRLFAGWLLAWYALVYLLGDFQMHKHLPIHIDLVDALFISSLVLRFTFGTFLFLLLTSIHAWMGRGIGKGLALTVLGVVTFVLFHVNVP